MIVLVSVRGFQCASERASLVVLCCNNLASFFFLFCFCPSLSCCVICCVCYNSFFRVLCVLCWRECWRVSGWSPLSCYYPPLLSPNKSLLPKQIIAIVGRSMGFNYCPRPKRSRARITVTSRDDLRSHSLLWANGLQIFGPKMC